MHHPPNPDPDSALPGESAREWMQRLDRRPGYRTGQPGGRRCYLTPGQRAVVLGGISFLPTQIPGLLDWVSRNGPRYETVDTSDPAVADGNAIYHHDVPANSGLSITHVQATADNRPLFKVGVVGTANADRFDGTNDYYAWGLTHSGAATIALRFRLTGTPGAGVYYGPVCLGNAGGDKLTQLFLLNLGGAYTPVSLINDCTSVNTAMVGFSPTLDTNAHTLIWTYNGGTITDTGSYTIRYDGAAQTVATSDVAAPTAFASNIGRRPQNDGHAPIDIADLLVYNSVLDVADQQKIERYWSA